MSDMPKINLAGLAWDLTGGAAEYCADCKRNFQGYYDPEDEPSCGFADMLGVEEESYHVPLQLFRNEGKDGMISLCWPCATRRMKPDFVGRPGERANLNRRR